MPENNDATTQKVGSDMAKVDAYALQAEDYEDAPEPTDEEFARGRWYIGGRPVAPDDSELMGMRISDEALAPMEELSPGWLERKKFEARELAAGVNGEREAE
jgi:hypothetical protein